MIDPTSAGSPELTPPGSSTPAPEPAGAPSAILVSAPGPDAATRGKIRFGRILMVAVPIAGALLLTWYMSTRSDLARNRQKTQAAERVLAKYPNQPETAYGYWRRILEEPASTEGMRSEARAAIQNLIDQHGLMARMEDLIGGLLQRGENDFVQARSLAAALVYLDTEFKTGETPAAGQARVEKVEAIRSAYADAINDKMVRSQFDKAIEKLTALYEQHPEAEFVRPTIARMQVEVADGLIQNDAREEAAVRIEKAIALDPLPLYRGKLAMLKADIEKLNPEPFLEKARAAEAAGNREEAQAQYEAALSNRKSNKEAKEGYSRILKFYAEVFLRNAEENNGELSEQGERFARLAEKSGKLLAQYGDESLVLARAELLLADSQFADGEYKKAKELADTGLASIAPAQRATKEGSYLMARAFKLYYHLGKIMNKFPEAKQALLLADQYCRLAMEQEHALASRLFVQIQNLQRLEMQDAVTALNESQTAPVQTGSQGGDVRNLVNEGPLNAAGPLDGIAIEPNVKLNSPDRTVGPMGGNAATPAPGATGPAPAKDGQPPRDPAMDRLLNPLR